MGNLIFRESNEIVVTNMEYEKIKVIVQTNKVISDFVTYLDLNVKNQSKIRNLAEKSVEFGFAATEVCKV